MAHIWKGIVKIQRPLFDSGGDVDHCLVYNEDRTLMQEVPFSAKDQQQLFDEDEFKIYCLAKINRQHKLVVLERVDEQDW